MPPGVVAMGVSRDEPDGVKVVEGTFQENGAVGMEGGKVGAGLDAVAPG